jgi:hypothetical protein
LKENIDNNISRTIRKDLKSAAEAGLKTRIWNDPDTYYDLFSKIYEKQNQSLHCLGSFSKEFLI